LRLFPDLFSKDCGKVVEYVDLAPPCGVTGFAFQVPEYPFAVRVSHHPRRPFGLEQSKKMDADLRN